MDVCQADGSVEGSAEGSREIRAGSLRLLASLWGRFPAAADFNALWPRFFPLLQPIMDRMPAEVSQAIFTPNHSPTVSVQVQWG